MCIILICTTFSCLTVILCELNYVLLITNSMLAPLVAMISAFEEQHAWCDKRFDIFPREDFIYSFIHPSYTEIILVHAIPLAHDHQSLHGSSPSPPTPPTCTPTEERWKRQEEAQMKPKEMEEKLKKKTHTQQRCNTMTTIKDKS